jgi:hypothetical protein
MLIDAISAYSQNRKSNKIKLNRPTYNIPGEILQNQAMYQNAANTTRLPGQSILENNIGASSAGSMNAVMQSGGSSTDILSALSSVNQNQNNAYNDMAVKGAEFQAMSKDKLASANSELSEYRDQQWQVNQYEPYQLEYARKMALKTAANANVNNMGRDMHAAGMSALSFAGPSAS